MADELDGCECVWSHEMAMRRLLYWIRQTQTTCTDTECTTEAVLSVPSNVGENFTMMTMFAILMVMLYFLRPSSSRPNINRLQKDNPDNNREDPNNDRPPPTVY